MSSRNDLSTKLFITNKDSWKTVVGYQDNEEEELQYGPGIVNKLKSRYLSRTLREKTSGESRRPALRRATSLENWLDKDGAPPSSVLNTSPKNNEKIDVTLNQLSNTRRPRPLSFNVVGSSVDSFKTPTPTAIRSQTFDNSSDEIALGSGLKKTVNGEQTSSPGPNTKDESVNFLPTTPPTPLYPKKPDHLLLSKDAIIIVEKGSRGKTEQRSTVVEPKPTSSTSSGAHKSRRSLPANTRYNVEEGELPAPDTVRQVKRIFEAGCSRKPSIRRSQSAGPGLNRVPLPADQDPSSLRVTKRAVANIPNGKPTVTPTRKISNLRAQSGSIAMEDKPVIITKPSSISPKPPPLTPKPVNISYKRPQRTSLPDALLPNSVQIPKSSPPTANVHEIELKIQPVKEDYIDQIDAKGSKIVSNVALENIRKESVSVSFRFDGKKEEKTQLIGSSTHSKQIGIIRPQVKTGTVKTEDSTQRGSSARSRFVQSSLQNKEDTKSPASTPTNSSNDLQIHSSGYSLPDSSLLGNEAVVSEASKSIEPPKSDIQSPRTIDVAPKTIHIINSKNDSTPVEGRALPSRVDTVAHNGTAPTSSSPKEASNNKAPTTGTSQNVTKGTSIRSSAKPWHQSESTTTTVFNFINSPKKVDHIRNEGGCTTIHLYKPNDSGITKLPDFDGGESSDFIDDLDILKRPPSPCNVYFEGANVILKKSLLHRRTKKVKMHITFNDEMTKLFEYPSEASLLEETDTPSIKTILLEAYPTPNESSTDKVPSGGLSSYTPSKVLIESTFMLGMSSSVSVEKPRESNLQKEPSTPNADAEYLRPSEEGTTWSSETTSDLLF